MKNILGVFILAATLISLRAEPKWLTSLPQAKEQAAKENKAILMDFTGSDWCPACRELKKNVFNTEEFAKYAEKNLVLVEVDFPKSKKLDPALKKANDELGEKYEIEGYPTIILLDAKGKKLKVILGYEGETPSQYTAMLDKVVAKALKKNSKR